jgi:IclR family transcriptional regulator, acetate operon repressor
MTSRIVSTVTEASEPDRVTAVDRLVMLLEALDGAEGLTLKRISQTTGLTEPTALRYLTRLRFHGLVERDEETGRYGLGIRLFQLGQGALRDRDPRLVALPIMKDLRSQFDETVNLAMRLEDDLVLIEALESTRSIKKGARVGESDVWHSSSLGKAILACLTEQEAIQILERRGHPRTTPRTLATVEALLRDFELVRERGYAIDDEESEEGLCCVGAPIFDRHRRPSYAISFSGPASRFSLSSVHKMGRVIKAAAKNISLTLGYIGETKTTEK